MIRSDKDGTSLTVDFVFDLFGAGRTDKVELELDNASIIYADSGPHRIELTQAQLQALILELQSRVRE